MKTGREDYDNEVICVRDRKALHEAIVRLRVMILGDSPAGLSISAVPPAIAALDEIEANLNGGRIPDDEPVFILRGQDSIGPFAVRHLAAHLGSTKGADAPTVASMYRQAEAMTAWPKSKLPDVPNR